MKKILDNSIIDGEEGELTIEQDPDLPKMSDMQNAIPREPLREIEMNSHRMQGSAICVGPAAGKGKGDFSGKIGKKDVSKTAKIEEGKGKKLIHKIEHKPDDFNSLLK